MKTLVVISLILISSTGFCLPYNEDWTFNNDYWIYYDGTGDGANMPHRNLGGQSGGYVYCNFAQSPAWNSNLYIPAQLLAPQINPPDAGGSLVGFQGSIYLNNLGTGNLHGAVMKFFVAEWEQVSEDWVVYMLNTPLVVGNDQWASTQFKITTAPKDWTKIDGGLNKSLGDILLAPQQYGFGFIGGITAPTGELGFDTFSLAPVPEPSSVLLTLYGIFWFGRFIFRKK